jgi:hypothetical protein
MVKSEILGQSKVHARPDIEADSLDLNGPYK